MGEQLAREAPVDADLVMPIPDSGTPAAIGFARASGIPFGEGLIKNRYVGRTFIQPEQGMREQGIRMKFNPLTEVAGKRVVIVDDTIVRGNTTRQITTMLFDAGAARGAHPRVSRRRSSRRASTASTSATPSSSSPAAAASKRCASCSARPRWRTSRSKGCRRRCSARSREMCRACFTGRYPAAAPVQLEKHRFEERSRPHPGRAPAVERRYCSSTRLALATPRLMK